MVAADGLPYGVLRLFAGIGHGVPAALTFGLVAGAAAAVTLRLAAGRTEAADATGSAKAATAAEGG